MNKDNIAGVIGGAPIPGRTLRFVASITVVVEDSILVGVPGNLTSFIVVAAANAAEGMSALKLIQEQAAATRLQSTPVPPRPM